MKVFRTPDGRIVQLADEKKMEHWDAAMPLIFIGEIREKRMPAYRKEFPKQTIAEIEAYLDDLLTTIAVPKLINALSGPNRTERLKVADNFLKLSESNPDDLQIALPHIEKSVEDPDKDFADVMKKSLKNYHKAQKRKLTAEKRKKLTELRKTMDDLDDQLAAGEITDDAYMAEQKNYLKLKREITVEEMDDEEAAEAKEKETTKGKKKKK
jgi:hypothetical protein